ncbi:single-stranded DNA-binding protein, partial [Paenarthrobacter nitroguajacolicus]
TGFETAKINRTQRSTAQGGQGAGGFGNQGNTGPTGQAAPQEDPWATPQTSGAGGPDSEPPF